MRHTLLNVCFGSKCSPRAEKKLKKSRTFREAAPASEAELATLLNERKIQQRLRDAKVSLPKDIGVANVAAASGCGEGKRHTASSQQHDQAIISFEGSADPLCV